jgi:hypothetical protein
MSQPAKKSHYIRITLCCLAGGVIGYIWMGSITSKEVIGYGNLGEQVFKLFAAAMIGCGLGATAGMVWSRISDATGQRPPSSPE